MSELSPSARLNILYALDFICKQASKHNFDGYVTLARSNITRLVELVIDCVRSDDGRIKRPPHREGAANVANVRKVIGLWRQKTNIIDDDTFVSLDTLLAAWPPGESKEVPDAQNNSAASKDLIHRRMEEDREKHKKAREDYWMRPTYDDRNGDPPFPDPEFQENWDNAQDLAGHDYMLMKDF
eukprot:jgi/Hompol1/1537/HPOL_004855-RA